MATHLGLACVFKVREGGGYIMVFKCPVCDGRGTVPLGFYNDESQEQCKACAGRGIVFGPEPQTVIVESPNRPTYLPFSGGKVNWPDGTIVCSGQARNEQSCYLETS